MKYRLFIPYFILLWGGQLSSKMVATGSATFNIFLISLYICFISRALIWYNILKGMELVKAYTIASLNYIFLPFISRIFVGEAILIKHLIGGVIISCGIILFAIGEEKKWH